MPIEFAEHDSGCSVHAQGYSWECDCKRKEIECVYSSPRIVCHQEAMFIVNGTSGFCRNHIGRTIAESLEWDDSQTLKITYRKPQ